MLFMYIGIIIRRFIGSLDNTVIHSELEVGGITCYWYGTLPELHAKSRASQVMTYGKAGGRGIAAK